MTCEWFSRRMGHPEKGPASGRHRFEAAGRRVLRQGIPVKSAFTAEHRQMFAVGTGRLLSENLPYKHGTKPARTFDRQVMPVDHQQGFAVERPAMRHRSTEYCSGVEHPNR